MSSNYYWNNAEMEQAVKEGDWDAVARGLLAMADGVVTKFHSTGVHEFDDNLIQDSATHVLLKLQAGKFNPSRGSLFNFATTCIRNECRQLMKKEMTRLAYLQRYMRELGMEAGDDHAD